MKKTLMLAVGMMMIVAAQAQNSIEESIEQHKETKVEQFLKTCSFTKTEYVYEVKQDNFVMQPLIITDLVTGNKIAGVRCSYDNTNGALGYYDFEEIDDVLRVLDEILLLSKQDRQYQQTYILWKSTSGVEIYYDAKENETFFRKAWKYVNQYGVLSTYYQSTDDTNIYAVGKIRQDLARAKTILEDLMAQ